MIAASITDLAGSSGWFPCGLVVYSNQAKQQLLGVSSDLLAQQGAVSEAVVQTMAKVARLHHKVDWALAVSGVAGPGGGTPCKPVGQVCFAWAGPSQAQVHTCHFQGDRHAIRTQATEWALKQLLLLVQNPCTKTQ
jgi:nicotinamide-nucleotide amidase